MMFCTIEIEVTEMSLTTIDNGVFIAVVMHFAQNLDESLDLVSSNSSLLRKGKLGQLPFLFCQEFARDRENQAKFLTKNWSVLASFANLFI